MREKVHQLVVSFILMDEFRTEREREKREKDEKTQQTETFYLNSKNKIIIYRFA